MSRHSHHQDKAPAARITGELLAFNVRSSDGWGTGMLVAKDGTRYAIVGKLVGAAAGETVELEGDWAEHQRYGRQFKFRSCTAVRPESKDGVIAWLCATLPGLGPARAHECVTRFGSALWDVIETDPRRLCAVDGITPARADAIAAAYEKNRADRDYMIKLRGWGLTDGQIARALEAWGTLAKAIEEVQRNPYSLSQYVFGFGFLRADAVAMKAGVKYDSPFRIAAGVEHVLDEQTTKGHCYVPSGMLVTVTAKLLGVDERAVVTAVVTAIRTGRAVRRGKRVYSSRLDQAEAHCASGLRRLLGRAA